MLRRSAADAAPAPSITVIKPAIERCMAKPPKIRPACIARTKSVNGCIKDCLPWSGTVRLVWHVCNKAHDPVSIQTGLYPAFQDCCSRQERTMTETSPTSRWLVTTDWLAARLGAPEIVAVDATYFLPNVKRDAQAEYPCRPHSRRGALRPRRRLRPLQSPAPHAAERRAVRARHRRARHRRHRHHRLLRRARHVLLAAGVVDVPAVRRAERVRARRRPAEVEGRRPAARNRCREAPAAHRSRRSSLPTSSPALPTCRRRSPNKSAQVVDSRPGRPLSRRGAGAAPGRALGPHPRLAERAVIGVGEGRQASAGRSASRAHSPPAASISTSR